MPGASAARNSGGAQKAFGEEREAREREGGGSRNYAQKAGRGGREGFQGLIHVALQKALFFSSEQKDFEENGQGCKCRTGRSIACLLRKGHEGTQAARVQVLSRFFRSDR